MSASSLVFIDETWASTNMTSTRGRSLHGSRCLGHAPYGQRKTTTFVCALRQASLRYLPPYSPDLNPIEQVFAKLKALLRRAQQRTVQELWDKVGLLLENFSADECRNYIRNSGYCSSG